MNVIIDSVAMAIAVIGTTSVWSIPYWARAAICPRDDWRWKHPELEQEPLIHYWRRILAIKVHLDFWPALIYYTLGTLATGGLIAALWFFVSPVAATALLVLMGMNGIRLTSWCGKFLFIAPSKGKAFVWLLLSLIGLFGLTQLPGFALWVDIGLGSAFVIIQWVSIRVFPCLKLFN